MESNQGEDRQDRGQIRDVRKVEELPGAILDALMEGMGKNPADFAILGMGFYVGYEGFDVMGFLMKPFNDMIGKIAAIFSPQGAVDLLKLTQLGGFGGIESLTQPLATLPVQMGAGWADLIKMVSGVSVYPNKHITPATKMPASLPPGVSYYGPPPEGFEGEWPPYGTTLAALEDKIRSDPSKTSFVWEQWAAEMKLKVLMGCVGAICAYTISRPGVAQAMIGAAAEVVSGALQGAGEAVPL